MEMYSNQIGQGAAWYAEDGEFSGFSLSEYFKAKKVDPSSRATGIGAYVFADPERVSEFLEMLRGKLRDQMKMQVVAGRKALFPYDHPGFASAVRHSVWYLPDVASFRDDEAPVEAWGVDCDAGA